MKSTSRIAAPSASSRYAYVGQGHAERAREVGRQRRRHEPGGVFFATMVLSAIVMDLAFGALALYLWRLSAKHPMEHGCHHAAQPAPEAR